MQLAMYHPSSSAAWAEALFVSVLQRSDRPGPGQVREAVAAAVRAYGGRGCAELVAQEFGDHPDTAVERMRWARTVADLVVTPLPESALAGPGWPAHPRPTGLTGLTGLTG